MNPLEVEDAVVEYRVPGKPSVRAVAGVSLTVAAGEVVGLVGESGCGKSSLGRAIVGLNPLDSGRVLIDGRPISPLGRRARPVADRAVQMVFQDPYSSLNPRRRVGRQIQDAIAGRGGAARVAELLESVGLPASAAARFPHQFSGGQRQRIAIARALASEPRVIVADEPVSALDASTRLQVAGLLSETATAQGVALLMISHDLSGLRVIADRIAVMYFGRIVEVGPTDAVWSNPRHPYTRALIGAIPRLGRDAQMPAEPPRRETVVVGDDDARLVECGPGHVVAAEALVAS
ncbi:ABC transporter ATP-binding protein [Agromyces atrinae]|uniref:ABC transporter ATP-binding protein n=1 Tax=Agromyces atrinae TaxID=592376 RepID=A0A4Q2MCK2_9MICO|nr:ATP-binding cassette domain-containing protein [Agromyces atrinae]NYD68080.1 peptide/nickel transport system ATP-binding protein [Agromyces atrinae]RXZ87772.1 ABC transporter ATP-binding protein [Agromyces atrinae]